MTEIPGNWGDWKPCKLCNIVQPPRSLDESGCCKDVDWCIKHRHLPQVPTNGTHKIGETKSAEIPDEMLAQPEAVKCDPKDPNCECAKEKKPSKRVKAKVKRKKK